MTRIQDVAAFLLIAGAAFAFSECVAALIILTFMGFNKLKARNKLKADREQEVNKAAYNAALKFCLSRVTCPACSQSYYELVSCEHPFHDANQEAYTFNNPVKKSALIELGKELKQHTQEKEN